MFETEDMRYGTSGMFRFSSRNAIPYLECPVLGKTGFITHAFCTRWGRTDRGESDILDFGASSECGKDSLLPNREIIRSAFDIPERNLVTVSQVHGNNILVIDETLQRRKYDAPLEYDGIISATAGIALGIKTADCVPIFLADRKKRIIGAIHAGWKGTSLGIIAGAVSIFVEEFFSDPEDILAVIGPAIGPCCYEVDEVVFGKFEETGSQSFFTGRETEGKWMFDLPEANRLQLIAAGIPPENIFSADICTSCNKNIFFSHRGENGCTGRQLNFIMLR